MHIIIATSHCIKKIVLECSKNYIAAKKKKKSKSYQKKKKKTNKIKILPDRSQLVKAESKPLD
jgi:hypothetical protein